MNILYHMLEIYLMYKMYQYIRSPTLIHGKMSPVTGVFDIFEDIYTTMYVKLTWVCISYPKEKVNTLLQKMPYAYPIYFHIRTCT